MVSMFFILGFLGEAECSFLSHLVAHFLFFFLHDVILDIISTLTHTGYSEAWKRTNEEKKHLHFTLLHKLGLFPYHNNNIRSVSFLGFCLHF